jgi:multiple sugar transport system permease protein
MAARLPRWRGFTRSWWPYILPALFAVVVINGAPLLYAFYLSFRGYNLAYPDLDRFVGLGNYAEMLGSPVIHKAMINTTVYTVVSTALSLVAGMVLALLVDGLTKGKRLFRTVFFLPMLLAPAVIGVMWRFLLNDQAGPITWLIKAVGIDVSPLSNPDWALLSVILVDVWQWTPFVFLVLLAGLESAPQEPLEAARVDGANPWQSFWYITLPGLVPLISVAVLFRVTWSFRSFDQIYTMTGGGPARSTELLALSVYRSAFEDLQVGMAAALSILMFVVMALFAGGVLRSQRRREAR